MLIDEILFKCDERYSEHDFSVPCGMCSFSAYCERSCEKCLQYIHYPKKAPSGAPARKYDCPTMADMYMCKYSYRYTSEMIYAFKRLKAVEKEKNLKVLSFGCGPCTDLFALDYLKQMDEYEYDTLDYYGVDYSEKVWQNIHKDIKDSVLCGTSVEFCYNDICNIIDELVNIDWIPNIITFQYVLSDMKKHTDGTVVNSFIKKLVEYINGLPVGTCIILNDINLSIQYGGGREYFDRIHNGVSDSFMKRGRFRDDNSRSIACPNGFPYGEDSDGEFSCNDNFFKWSLEWDEKYSPFKTCASAQMIIVRR